MKYISYQTLKKLIEQLDQTKADKIFVNNELDKVNILKSNIKFLNFSILFS